MPRTHSFPDEPQIDEDHAQKLHELPNEYLVDVLPIAKKTAVAQGLENYNILQNNGRIAHQVFSYSPSTLTLTRLQTKVVDHVHFHVIPKPSESDKEGLVIGWPTKEASKDKLVKLYDELYGKL